MKEKGDKMRIAIVDDEPEVCAAVRDYLIHILEKY